MERRSLGGVLVYCSAKRVGKRLRLRVAMAAPQEAIAKMGKLLLAHDADIANIRQQLELDFIVKSETVKANLVNVMADGEARGKGKRAFREVVAQLYRSSVPGTTRLYNASDTDMGNLILRFKPHPHKNPLAGKPWRFVFAMSTSAPPDLREGVAALAAAGGDDRVIIRRPLARMGPLARELEEFVDPERAAKRRADEEAKGRGRGRGRGAADGGGRGGRGAVDGGGRGGPRGQGGWSCRWHASPAAADK